MIAWKELKIMKADIKSDAKKKDQAKKDSVKKSSQMKQHLKILK